MTCDRETCGCSIAWLLFFFFWEREFCSFWGVGFLPFNFFRSLWEKWLLPGMDKVKRWVFWELMNTQCLVFGFWFGFALFLIYSRYSSIYCVSCCWVGSYKKKTTTKLALCCCCCACGDVCAWGVCVKSNVATIQYITLCVVYIYVIFVVRTVLNNSP